MNDKCADIAWLNGTGHNAFLFLASRVVVCTSPKVGSQTIRAATCRAHGIDCPRGTALFQVPVPVVPPEELLKKRDDLQIIGVVREPRSRLYSCWADKILGPVARRKFCERNKLKLSITWPEFVAWACRDIPTEEMEWHIRPQWWFLSAAGQSTDIVCDKIIQLSQLSAELRRLVPWLRRRAQNVKGRKRARRREHKIWTPELMQMHREAFARDFEEFGYD